MTSRLAYASRRRATPDLRIHRGGLLTTVQDAGRWGYQAFGVPVAAHPTGLHALANRLVANAPEAATLQVRP